MQSELCASKDISGCQHMHVYTGGLPPQQGCTELFRVSCLLQHLSHSTKLSSKKINLEIHMSRFFSKEALLDRRFLLYRGPHHASLARDMTFHRELMFATMSFHSGGIHQPQHKPICQDAADLEPLKLCRQNRTACRPIVLFERYVHTHTHISSDLLHRSRSFTCMPDSVFMKHVGKEKPLINRCDKTL